MSGLKVLLPTLAFSFLAGAPALAAHGDHPENLMFLVTLIDGVPTRAALDAAAAGDQGAGLVAIARDSSLPRYPRTRAAAMLGAYSGPRVAPALEGIIATADDIEVRIQAIASLAQTSGDGAIPRLEGLIQGKQPELSAASARALARMNTARARQVLSKHLPLMPPSLRRSIERRLSRIDRP